MGRHTRHKGVQPLPLLGLAALAAVAATGYAVAQTALPGIVITAPPPSMPGGQPPTPMSPPLMAPQPQAPAAAQPAAKPKPKPKTTTAAKPAAGSGEGIKSGAGTGIAMLVNGDPITAYEIDQRARLMALQSDIQSRAQAKFKEMAQSESVNARFKEIVQETIQANQGKTP